MYLYTYTHTAALLGAIYACMRVSESRELFMHEDVCVSLGIPRVHIYKDRYAYMIETRKYVPHAHTHAHTHTHTHAHTHTCIQSEALDSLAYVYMHTHIYTY